MNGDRPALVTTGAAILANVTQWFVENAQLLDSAADRVTKYGTALLTVLAVILMLRRYYVHFVRNRRQVRALEDDE